MHEIHFWVLRMKWTTMDIAAAGTANHKRGRGTPAIVGFSHHVYDLIKSTTDEVHELKFRDRSHPGKRRSERSSDNRRFRDRCIDDALRSKAVNEAVSDFESAA